MIAQRLQRGWLVNLGIGIPTLASNFVGEDRGVVFTSENGVIGYSGLAGPDEVDPDVVNAGGQPVTLVIHRKDGRTDKIDLKLRLDTPAEIAYVRRGGILPYMLNKMTA